MLIPNTTLIVTQTVAFMIPTYQVPAKKTPNPTWSMLCLGFLRWLVFSEFRNYVGL
jgi:hypothetical protein